MLLSLDMLVEKYALNIKGVLHVGAHLCEEYPAYRQLGLDTEKIIWLEALEEKVAESRARYPGIRIYQFLAHDVDDKTACFFVTNNYQSSSILPLAQHIEAYPGIKVMENRELVTGRIDTLYRQQDIPPAFANFLNLDIQGNELNALKGMSDLLTHFDAVYSEVNEEHLYMNCCLIDELDDYLAQFHFERVETKMTGAGWGDALYLKRK